MRILFLLIFGCFINTGFIAHEFHLSKCQIDFNEEEQALQMMMHLFIDDTEEALRKNGHDKLFLCTEKESEDAELHLFDYLKKQFNIEVNGQLVDYNFVGKETSEDLIAVWVYLEVTEVEKIEQIKVTNKILTEVFDDQKNIMSVTVPKGQEYFILDKGKHSEMFEF